MSKLLPQKIVGSALAKLRREHYAYMAEVRKSDAKITKYRAPCCGVLIETLQASRGQVWDTMARCPECGRMHIKITRGAKAYGFIPE